MKSERLAALPLSHERPEGLRLDPRIAPSRRDEADKHDLRRSTAVVESDPLAASIGADQDQTGMSRREVVRPVELDEVLDRVEG